MSILQYLIEKNNISRWFMNDVFRTWWFDPVLSTICFGIFINWYWYYERKFGISRDVTFQETVTLGFSPLNESFIAYWLGILLWVNIIPPASQHIPDGIPQSLTDFMYLIAEVVSGIVLYDAIFFAIHWSMHEVPILRHWHARHHECQHNNKASGCCSNTTSIAPLESRDILRHSLIDGSLQVLVNILVQRHCIWGTVKTRLARAIHNILVTWMLTESHTAAPIPYIWRHWCIGVREHYNHHTYNNITTTKNQKTLTVTTTTTTTAYNINRTRYQQFFGYLDDLRMSSILKQK